MPRTSDGDTVICVGREIIEALSLDEPVKVGDGEYLLRADSYDYPYRRVSELEDILRDVQSCLVEDYSELSPLAARIKAAMTDAEAAPLMGGTSLSVSELKRVLRWFNVATNEGEIDVPADCDLAERIEAIIARAWVTR